MTGSLIDSGVAAKFGSSRPLIVMKGYVTPPVDKDNETVIPQGIIHENKDDLRMGAMAFNNNGAGTECQTANVNDTIVQYCPDGTLDGAKVIAPIKNSDATTEGVDHLDYLTKQINASAPMHGHPWVRRYTTALVIMARTRVGESMMPI